MTELFILGLLHQQPMSGYDIQQALISSNVELWGGILVGSIYHALHKLEKNQYITIAETKITGKRKTKIYAINKAGKNYLQSLIINHLETTENIFPSGTFAAITFSHLLSSKQTVSALNKQVSLLKQKMENIIDGEQEKEKVYIDSITKETFRYMTESLTLQRNYLNNIIEIIESENNNDN